MSSLHCCIQQTLHRTHICMFDNLQLCQFTSSFYFSKSSHLLHREKKGFEIISINSCITKFIFLNNLNLVHKHIVAGLSYICVIALQLECLNLVQVKHRRRSKWHKVLLISPPPTCIQLAFSS